MDDAARGVSSMASCRKLGLTLPCQLNVALPSAASEGEVSSCLTRACTCRLAAALYILRCLPSLLGPTTLFGVFTAFLIGIVCTVAALLALGVRMKALYTDELKPRSLIYLDAFQFDVACCGGPLIPQADCKS